MSTTNTILSNLKHRYRALRIVEVIIETLGLSIITWAIASILELELMLRILITTSIAIASFCLRYYQLKLHEVNEKSITSFLNKKYEVLHSSTDLLLLTDNNLTTLGKLQQIKTQKNLEGLAAHIEFPNQLKASVLFTCTASIVFFTVLFFDFRLTGTQESIQHESPEKSVSAVIKNKPVEILEAKALVVPPTYTGIKPFTINDFNIHVPEGSNVTWSVKFTGNVTRPGIVISSQDTMRFSKKNDVWEITETLLKNGFYQIVWTDSCIRASDFYKIDLTKDKQPVIKLTSLNQFTEISHDSKQKIQVNPVITDDFGIKDAYIIATVSKGSGESVKFREEKITFTSPPEIKGKALNCKQTIDIHKLGMEPGDELYFYVEAWDNKNPNPNRSRTEMYFISLQDTAKDVIMADAGLGVDLMPEYFRSQRQIIIDTEKLIREKSKTTKHDFDFKSNELGYDQKVLRLRYGQFMGEEFESEIGGGHNHDEEEEIDAAEEQKGEKDILKEFGHEHDTENEHNLVDDKKKNGSKSTNRKVEGGDPDKKEDPFAKFVHEHDNEETATFFFQSLKMKLREALNQMWDAELHLRLYEPEKSLPYQYKALKLLKEISNDSRIYVHRTGFEPPPIKEENRLSADLLEVFNSSHQYTSESKKQFPRIIKALNVIEYLLAQSNPIITTKERTILIQSGSELAQAALEQPVLLRGLSALKLITTDDNTKTTTQDLIILRKAYWNALPQSPDTATKKASSLHSLDEQFIRQLRELKP